MNCIFCGGKACAACSYSGLERNFYASEPDARKALAFSRRHYPNGIGQHEALFAAPGGWVVADSRRAPKFATLC